MGPTDRHNRNKLNQIDNKNKMKLILMVILFTLFSRKACSRLCDDDSDVMISARHPCDSSLYFQFRYCDGHGLRYILFRIVTLWYGICLSCACVHSPFSFFVNFFQPLSLFP